MVAGDAGLAADLAAIVEVDEIAAGAVIIEDGASDNQVFLILTGKFQVLVKGRVVATRGASDHVGEMAAIDPVQPRSATVIAVDASVVAKVSETHLTELANKYPDVWRRLATELARRLVQRNALVVAPRNDIKVFVVSSAEALVIAQEVQSILSHEKFEVTVWTDGVFGVSDYALDSLEKALDESDFAIAIGQPDDITEQRGAAQPTPRDNVVFELGLFIGRLGRRRTILLEPSGEAVRLPSDLKGLTTIRYKHDRDKNLTSQLGPACTQIRKHIADLGPRD